MKLNLSFLRKTFYTSFFGSCLSLTGLFLFVCETSIYRSILGAIFFLGPDSLIVNYWTTPEPFFLDFYMFNWTNPHEINDPHKKPKFEEIGPYRFKETKIKVNLSWNANDTVTYRHLRHWYFVEDYPSKKLEDKITTLNPITVTIASQAKHWNYVTKRGLSLALGILSPQLHLTKTVGELLFEGYRDHFLNLAETFPFLSGNLNLFDKFGYMYMRNGSYTYDGIFNVETGSNASQIGELKYWKYSNISSAFKDSCSKINGSLGDLFKIEDPESPVSVFSSDICRKFYLDYEKDVSINSLKCHKYSGDKRMLDNGFFFPETKCHCAGECIPLGVLNLTSCKDGAPVFLSLPHFYKADPVYLSSVEGLEPEKSKHEMYITIEPKTGISLAGSYRIQFNIHLQPIQHLTLFEKVPDIFMPIVWFEQKYEVPNQVTWIIKFLLALPIIFTVISIVFMTFGTILMLHGVYKLTKRKSYEIVVQNENSMEEEDENENIYMHSTKLLGHYLEEE